MKYYTRFTRLVNSQKLANRFLTAQIKDAPETEKTSMGTLFCLVEINRAWFPSAQIGQTIINTLAREYYRGSSTSDLINFENALRKVNETLAQITQNGETEWIGNLNSVLALVCNNQIHLASAGTGRAYLYRKGKFLDIIENSTEESPHPLKTYGEITSGALEPNDKIIITSPALMDYFTIDKLKDKLLDSPFNSASGIAKILKREKAKYVNLIILEFLSEEKIPAIDTNENETVYLDKQSFELINNLGQKFLPGLKSFGQKLQTGFSARSKQTHDLTKKYIVPHAQKGLDKTRDLTNKTYSHLKSQATGKIKSIFTPKKEKVPDVEIVKEESFNKNVTPGKVIYTVHHYEHEKKNNNLWHTFSQTFKKIWAKTSISLHTSWRWAINPKNRSRVYIIIIAILLLILVANIGLLRNRQSNFKKQISSEQTINELKVKNEEAKLALNYNNKDKAKKLFEEIYNQALGLVQAGNKNQEVQDILTQSQQELDNLTSTKRLNNLTKLAEFPSSSNLFVNKNDYITVGPKDGKIYYSTSQDKNVNSYSSLPNTAGQYRAGVITDTTSELLLFTDKNKCFQVKDLKIAPDEINPKENTWENVTALSTFSGNLYLLDGPGGQIYKHVKDPDGYAKGENYINTQEVDLKDSVSLAIDGAIYVLKNDGAVVKLIKGGAQNFNLQNIPNLSGKIDSPKKIWTDTSENSIYILDEIKIIELDKTGKFISQIAFSTEITTIEDFSINTQSKKIWILSSNKLYEANL